MNPQASWAGIGWELRTGSIDQVFQSCTDNGYSAGGNDSCVYTDTGGVDGIGRYTLTLNGQSSMLVPVAGVANAYRLRDDPGWQVSYDTVRLAWTVTTPEGTRYYFGWATTTNSQWKVPVNNEAGGYVDRPWRWALSNVRDTSDNMIAYYYATESNWFKASDDAMHSYTRAGRLSRVEFGRVFGDVEASNLETAAMDYGAAYRCDATDGVCPDPPSPANPEEFPDVPVDLLCGSAPPDCEQEYPTFFTDYRLASVTSSVKVGTVMEPVDQVILRHALLDAQDYVVPPEPEDDADKQLWLNSVQTIGLDGASPDVSLPKTEFSGVPLDNRADAFKSYALRLSNVSNPLGGSTAVTYFLDVPCPPSGLEGSAERADWDCFVDVGRRDNDDTGYVWYYKYLVQTVTTTANTGAQSPPVSQVWTYDYDGDLTEGDGCLVGECRLPQVHHNSFAVSSNDLTFSLYRGYGEVQVTTGASRDVYRVFRGMHMDRDVDFSFERDNTTFADLPSYHDLALPDWDWFKSRVYEHSRYDGPTLVEVTTTAPTWAPRSSPPSTDPATYNGSISEMAVDGQVLTTVDVPGGTDRLTRTQLSYDADGLLTNTIEHGDTATTTDDRCTSTSYAKNTPAWVLVPSQVAVRAGTSCTGGPILEQTRTLYDELGYAVAPTRGLLTEVREYDTASTFSATKTDYDALGRVTKVTDPNGNDTTTGYSPEDPADGPPEQVTVTNDLGHATVTTLHPRRLLPVTTTDANGHLTTASYDGLGRLINVWQPTEATSEPASLQYVYAISATKAAPPKVTTKVLQSFIDTGGGNYTPTYLDTFEYYDGLGRRRETQTVAPEGIGRVVTAIRYDDRGLVAAETGQLHMTGGAGSGLGNPSLAGIASETRYGYDGLGRVSTATVYSNGAPTAMVTTSSYGGTSTTLTPAAGMAVTTSFDGYGRTSKISEGNIWDTLYGYDLLDNLTTVTDELGNLTSYGYDMASRRTSSTDPDAGHWTYGYDKVGNTQSTTDAKSQTTWAVYDQLNRQTTLRQTSATGTVLASWTYDLAAASTTRNGLLVASTSRVDGHDYKINNMMYDARDRLTARTYVIPSSPDAAGVDGSYTFSYGYDRADHRTSVTYPGGGGLSAETVNTIFSSRGYEVSTAGSNTYIAQATYKNYGLLARRDYGGTGSLVRKYSYDTATRWLDKLTTDFNGTTPQDSTYGRDLVGNVTSIDTGTAGNIDECLTYDPANRLVQAVTRYSPTATCDGNINVGTTGYNQVFGYDAIGRITSRDIVSPPSSTEQDQYHYNGASPHAVTDVEHVGGTSEPPYYTGITATYEYDPNGHRTGSATGLGGATELATSYVWNRRHQLVQTTVDDGTNTDTSTYIYDADRNRLIRNDADGPTLYLDGTEIQPAAASEPSLRYYTISEGVLVGLRAASQAWTRVLLNHQGSTQYTIKNNTTTVNYVQYQPYGKTTIPTGALPTDRRYLHAPNDDETGLIQLGARYYDPNLAQFISPDPLLDPTNPQTLNGYTNAANNPLTYTDPTGLAVECGCGGGGGSYDPPGSGDNGSGGGTPPPPPPASAPDDVFAGLPPAYLAQLAVELGTTGQLYDYPGIYSVPLTAWEYDFYGVAETIQIILDNADNFSVKKTIAFVDDTFLGVGDLFSCSGVGSCVLATASIVPFFKPIKYGSKLFKAADGIPDESAAVIRSIQKDGVIVQSGVKGPSVPGAFANDGRHGGQLLPAVDPNGQAITYREWGTVPRTANPKPGGERIVTGSEGSIYYSPEHYQAFIRWEQ